MVTRWREIVRRRDGHLEGGRRRRIEVVLRPDVGAAVARAAVHDRRRGHSCKKSLYHEPLAKNNSTKTSATPS